MSHDGGIYTTKISKHYKSVLFRVLIVKHLPAYHYSDLSSFSVPGLHVLELIIRLSKFTINIHADQVAEELANTSIS